MRSLVRIGLLALAVPLLWTPVQAQDSPAKDGDEIGSTFNQLADRDYLARCSMQARRSETISLREGATSGPPVNLTPPEQFWAVHKAHRTANAARPRCMS
jgi:hypothetical protein